MRGAILAALVAIGLALPGCGRAPERVVVVTIDTLRADRVGAWGYPEARTPVLDGLAARGVRFETAVSPAPLTLPSHATLLTGLDPPRHGVRHNSVFRLHDSVPLVTERFAAAGWETAAVIGAVVLDARYGLARGFGHYDDAIGSDDRSGLVGYAERSADQVVDRALAWIEEAPERFFLWVHFYDPHGRYEPPPPFSTRFRDSPYDGEIAFVDQELGRLLDGLAERFDARSTVVLVTSDHGESLGQHHELTHSYTLYEPTQRVPLLLAGAGVPEGRRVREPVALADVAPTLLALAGLPALEGVDGRDLAPLWRGEPFEERPAHLETLATQLDFGWSPLLGIRSARFKYVRAPRPELYDLEADPREAQNLAASDPERAAALDRELELRLAASEPPPLERVALPAEERRRLEALGYVVPSPNALLDSDRLGRVGGVDPKDRMGLLGELLRAEALLGAGRPDAALEMLSKVEEPGAQVLTLRAAALLGVGDLAAAERDARAALSLLPDREDALLTLGAILERTGRVAEARALYQRGRSSVVPGELFLRLGRTAEALGDVEEAARSYEQALAAGGGSEATWRLAALRLEAGREAEADALIERLTVDQQLEPTAAIRLAHAETRAGRETKARVRLREAQRREPENALLALAHGVVLEMSGRLEEALRVREEALARRPDAPHLQNAVAWSLLRLDRDLDRALDLAQQASQRAGEDPSILDTLAALRLARGQPSAALQAVERALAAGGDPGRLHYLRADALAALGRREAAREALAQSLAAASAQPEAPWHGERRRLAEGLGLAAPASP